MQEKTRLYAERVRERDRIRNEGITVAAERRYRKEGGDTSKENQEPIA